MGHKISKEQIDPGVKDHIMSFVGNINELETDEKSNIIDAVNSLIVDRIDNVENMEKLANAIGEPVTANHSVDEVVEGLGEMLSTFKTNMMNSGVVVESGDKFKQLIEKIKGLTEGEGNKGIQFAEGKLAIPSTPTLPLTIKTNLSFTPNIIFIHTDVATAGNYTIYGFTLSNLQTVTFNLGVGTIKDITDKSFTIANIGGSFTIAGGENRSIKWYAIGVGEEDTTLRDSLASILQEEGVNITEEDDMASLITKVDEEFTKDNNTINNLNTEKTNLTNQVNNLNSNIENTRNTLAGLMQEGGYDITGNESMDRLLDLLVLSGISVSDVKQIACGEDSTFILKNDGSLWSCGDNLYGQLGLGTSGSNTNKTTFTKVTTNINNDVKQIACGHSHTVILKTNGSVWSCGYNKYGQLGLNSTTQRTSFTQVTTNINNDVKQIACGYNYTFIIKNDGSIWCCGNNGYGQLGLGTTGSSANKTTFTQVTKNISNDVKQIACGEYHTVILKTNGSVWSCGSNTYGQLGLNDSDARLVFTQVTKNISNDVKQIACGSHNTFILKTNGSVWSCGFNEYGQLGLGNTTNKTSFTQVTTNINNDVKQIACGYYYTFILKNDGSVWGCGDNDYGHLGLNDTTQRTSFTQVTTNINNDVKQIACGYNYTFILKTNGSVWSCGKNDYGQLGLNDDTDKKTFTQVPRGF